MMNRKELLERVMFEGGMEAIFACREYVRLSKIEAFQSIRELKRAVILCSIIRCHSCCT